MVVRLMSTKLYETLVNMSNEGEARTNRDFTVWAVWVGSGLVLDHNQNMTVAAEALVQQVRRGMIEPDHPDLSIGQQC